MTNVTMKFWSQVDKTETCWNWTGCVINNGYGKIGYAGKQILVHRYSYEMSGDTSPRACLLTTFAATGSAFDLTTSASSRARKTANTSPEPTRTACQVSVASPGRRTAGGLRSATTAS
jgi:hypothetical protein